MFKKINRRGQAMVLYALLIPLLFLFVGVGLDLGWYYLNVSRLQNAADAAALAGAQALVKKDLFKEKTGTDKNAAFADYYIVQLASNQLPEDFWDYQDVFKNTFDNSTIASGELKNYWKIEDAQPTLEKGRQLAEKYARLNLQDQTTVSESDDWQTLSATDAWNKSAKEEDKKVNGVIELKYKGVDGKNDVYGPMYYVVSLREKIHHFLLPGWFEPMDAPVKAVVLLQPHDDGLITPMEALEREEVIDNWEYTNNFKDPTTGLSVSGGKWNHYQAGIRNNSNYGIRYTSGNVYRTESVMVTPSRKTAGKNVVSRADGSSGEATNANGGTFYPESEVDSINIDFRAEVTGKFKSDWDIGYAFPETGHNYQFTENGSWTATNGADKRILFNADFNESFKSRPGSERADPLYVRIESDPIKNPYTSAGVSNFNSVRQITLNFNDDNSIVEGSGESQQYKYRPYVIFYTGPENIDYTTDKNGVLIRHSQPVVINLNENTNAILYFPESPVVLNGNGKKLTGFVIAKCFLLSVTEEDMTNGGTFELYDGFNTPQNFKGDFITGIDGGGYTIYFKNADLFTKEEIDNTYKNATILIDETTGNLTVKELIPAPKRILLNYSKEDSTKYEVKNANGVHDENATFAAYVNATYKKTFKTFSGLSDSEITAVTFPNENYNEATATYYVESTDVSDTAIDANYVKVKVGDADKYIDKANLPYVKVRTNNEYFYVSVSDLQLLKDLKGNKNDNKGVRMVDTTDGDKDIYVNPTSIDKYGDSWKIDRTRYDNKEFDNWKSGKLEFSEKDGIPYFMLKSEITTEPQVVAKYRKITLEEDDGTEVVKYIRDDDDNVQYYTKIENNKDAEGNTINYIITDKNGNMLTKTLTPAEVFKAKTESANAGLENKSASLNNYYNTYTRKQKDPQEIPGDKGQIINGRYVGKSQSRLNKDYRIPALERVYKKSVFNLSEESMYSYFFIDELWRVNYTYLNVDEFKHTVNRKDLGDAWKCDDMFFTYERALWID
ncbi:MAG: pilus assembly protein [Selenomonadaceae bacterium]|nr:pilus assembly protein [Selenomonadaceae bacterium]